MVKFNKDVYITVGGLLATSERPFKTGCVLKYSAIVVLMSCVLISQNLIYHNAKINKFSKW